MRKILFIFISYIIYGLVVFTYANTNNVFLADEPKQEKILISRKNNSVEQNKPKAPAFIPMEVYYNSSMSSLMFTFISDLGNVTVNVTNMSDGEWLEGTVNAQAGVTALFPISGEAGHYILTITLQNGTEYEGIFDIE